MILMACLMYVFHKFQRRYLTDNNIGDTGATSLSEALKSNTTLITLYMNRENKKMSKKMSIIKTLFSFCFILTVNEIGDTGATSLSEALKSNTTLTELYLLGEDKGRHTEKTINNSLFPFFITSSGNEIGDIGVSSLSEALKSNTTLTELKLTSDHTPRRLTNDINSLDSLCSS